MGFEQLLLGLVSSYRYDKELVDNMIAKSEAATLHEAIKTKQLDHDQVVWILSTRNVFQLRATFDYYKLHYGKPIEEVYFLYLATQQELLILFNLLQYVCAIFLTGYYESWEGRLGVSSENGNLVHSLS